MLKSLLAENKKALFDYDFKERLEAGIVLSGAEVKSARQGKVGLRGSFVRISGNEAFALGIKIAPYQKANQPSYKPTRARKLLLKRREITRLSGILSSKGAGAIPLKMYLKNNIIKLEIGVGRGKKKYDKRRALRKKAVEREIERDLKGVKSFDWG